MKGGNQLRKMLKTGKKQIGATAIEYAVVAGLMALLLTAIFSETGSFAVALNSMFETIAETIEP